MSMRSLLSSITHEARKVLNNRKLRVKDLIEWSSIPIPQGEGEITLRLPINAVYVCYPVECDKRVKS